MFMKSNTVIYVYYIIMYVYYKVGENDIWSPKMLNDFGT